MDVILKIKHEYDNFSPSEKKVAKYILENIEKIPDMNIKNLAVKSNSSESAIVRFCKRLEIKSYKKLKMYLYNENNISKNNNITIEEILTDDNNKEIFKKIAAYNIKGIEDTLKVINYDKLDEAINTILNARKVIICGLGGSSIVAADAMYKFTRIGIATSYSYDSHLQLTTVAVSEEKDVILMVSTSGKTREIIEMAQVAKSNGAKIITITQYQKSPLAELSDIVLNIANVESNLRIGTMSSRIAELTVIDSIFTGICVQHKSNIINKIQTTKEIIQNLKRY